MSDIAWATHSLDEVTYHFGTMWPDDFKNGLLGKRAAGHVRSGSATVRCAEGYTTKSPAGTSSSRAGLRQRRAGCCCPVTRLEIIRDRMLRDRGV